MQVKGNAAGAIGSDSSNENEIGSMNGFSEQRFSARTKMQTSDATNDSQTSRNKSQGPNHPPRFCIELLSPIRWALRAFITCRFLKDLNAEYSITKPCKFFKSTNGSQVTQRRVLGTVSHHFDRVECNIDVQYLKDSKNTSDPHAAQSKSVEEKIKKKAKLSLKESLNRYSYNKNESMSAKSNVDTRPDTPMDSCNTNSVPKQDQVTPPDLLPQMNYLSHTGSNLEVNAEMMKKLWQDGTFSDVIIISPNGRRFPAHRSILSVRSRKFFEILCSKRYLDYINSNSLLEIQLHDIHDDSLHKLLEYIYTGGISKLDSNVIDLYRTAEKFEFSDLKELCIRSFKDKLDINNASDILILTDEVDLPDLKKHVMQFMNQNIQLLFESESFKRMTESKPKLIVELYYLLGKNK
ncbi:hypothetical protein QAD02_019528 [Eretmocerus hayati]|uniref:Uncharacterized protein n=1 Tax=Eretmocerus hayati TaxID=131215 RepID=A0ACC2PJV0_9HYME|nr:hypothetical protein QAD02_019528 [Eretmocerus hayati]